MKFFPTAHRANPEDNPIPEGSPQGPSPADLVEQVREIRAQYQDVQDTIQKCADKLDAHPP